MTEQNTCVKKMSSLAYIRLNPLAYIPDTSKDGLNYQACELIQNAINALPHRRVPHDGLVEIALCRDFARGTFQLIIRDNGRGIPLENLISVYTDLHITSKRYVDTKYNKGIGAKVAASLSNKFRVLTHRSDGIGSLLIDKGLHPSQIDIAPVNGEGVVVVYEPDMEIFSDVANHVNNHWHTLPTIIKANRYSKWVWIAFRITDTPISPLFWDASILEAEAFIKEAEESADLYMAGWAY